MQCDFSKPKSAPANFAPEANLQKIARFIVRSKCPEVARHEVLVRLKQLVAAEMAVTFKARIEAPNWPDRFAA